MEQDELEERQRKTLEEIQMQETLMQGGGEETALTPPSETGTLL